MRKVLVVGLTPNRTTYTAETHDRLKAAFPDHEVLVIPGLTHVEEIVVPEVSTHAD